MTADVGALGDEDVGEGAELAAWVSTFCPSAVFVGTPHVQNVVDRNAAESCAYTGVETHASR